MGAEKAMFLTVEGAEGVGKSTHIETIKKFLDSRDIPHILTREPGGTPVAERIRELLLAVDEDETLCELSELLLVFAARAQHLAEKIRPALERGDWVLSDRFVDATWAYQGAGRGLDRDAIGRLEQLVVRDTRPDMTLLFDVPVDVGMARAGKRAALDRIEQEDSAFFERIRQCYLERAGNEPDRFRVLDASCDLEQVRTRLQPLLEEMLTWK